MSSLFFFRLAIIINGPYIFTQDDVSESEDTAGSRKCQHTMDDETRKRGINICFSLEKQDV